MQFGEKRWPEMAGLGQKVVVLPLGSTEQHGRHLPLLTDTVICQEIVRRADAELGDEALFLPLLWVGVSEHHRAFPGTVSVQGETYTNFVADVLESLIGGGFRRILLLNAHGGNSVPGHAALYKAQMRHRDERDLWLVFATWYAMAAPQIAAMPQLEQRKVTHACELETSMVLRLRPELVDLDAAQAANVPFDSAFYSPDSSRRNRVSVSLPLDHVSQSGALGHPEVATAEKGEALFVTAVNELVACVREIAAWQPFDPG
jgi:creatinine amidohydrolase